MNKLTEKFFDAIEDNVIIDHNFKSAAPEAAEKCSQICEEEMIMFAKWKDANGWNCNATNDMFWKISSDGITGKQLLEKYKQENP